MTIQEQSLKLHETWGGKLSTEAKCTVNSREDLALAYTPGVAEPCKVLQNIRKKYTVTPSNPIPWQLFPTAVPF